MDLYTPVLDNQKETPQEYPTTMNTVEWQNQLPDDVEDQEGDNSRPLTFLEDDEQNEWLVTLFHKQPLSVKIRHQTDPGKHWLTSEQIQALLNNAGPKWDAKGVKNLGKGEVVQHLLTEGNSFKY